MITDELARYRENRPPPLGPASRVHTLEGIDPKRTALVIIDMQNWDAHRDFAPERWRDNPDYAGYWDRLDDLVVPNHVELLEAFRSIGARVVFTIPASYFEDCADANPNNRALWREAGAVMGSVACEIRSEILPRFGEAVLPKVSSDAWSSCGIDYVLRNAGVTKLFFTGVVSTGCVANSAMGAWGVGYDVNVIEDAIADFTPEAHRQALARLYGAGIWSTSEVLEALPPAQVAASATS